MAASKLGWRPLLREVIRSPKVEFVQCDVLTSTGRKKILPLLKDVRTLVHLERVWGGDQDHNEALDNEIAKNLCGSVEFINLAYAFVEKVIFTSSTDVYGLQVNQPITEENDPNPSSLYSVTKLSIENYLRLLSEAYKKSLIVLRVATIYGPYERSNKAIPNFVRAILANQKPIVNGNGRTQRDFIFVRDVCKAIHLSILSDFKSQQLFNISTGKSYSLNQVIRTINRILGKNLEPRHIIGRSSRNQASYVFDSAKSRLLLDFVPDFGLWEGLRAEISWFQTSYKKEN